MSDVAVITTFNQTSFAVAYADATALVLDAVSVTGQRRADLFDRAKARANHALGYVHGDNKPEAFLARQLLAYIEVSEQQRWNY